MQGFSHNGHNGGRRLSSGIQSRRPFVTFVSFVRGLLIGYRSPRLAEQMDDSEIPIGHAATERRDYSGDEVRLLSLATFNSRVGAAAFACATARRRPVLRTATFVRTPTAPKRRATSRERIRIQP